MTNKGIRYDEEIKKCIIDLYNDGWKINSISKKYNITRATIHKWIKEYSLIESVSYETIKNQVENLKIENEILKKSNYMLFMKDKGKILDFIYNHKEEYGVGFMCQVFNIPRSTYYKLRIKSEGNEKPEKSINDSKTINIDYKSLVAGSEEIEGEIKKTEVSEKPKEKDIRRDSNAHNITIFNEIDFSKFNFVKTYLDSKLGINITCNVEKGSPNVIERIYKHCLNESKLYSWTSIKNTVLENYKTLEEDDLGYDYKNNAIQIEEAVNKKMDDARIKNDSVYEEAIEDHCIIISLYTVEYLLQKSKFVETSQLGNRIKGMGYNFLSSNKYFNNSFEFDNDGNIRFERTSEYKVAFPIDIDMDNLAENNDKRSDAIRRKINYNLYNKKKFKGSIKPNPSWGAVKIKRNKKFELVNRCSEIANKEGNNNQNSIIVKYSKDENNKMRMNLLKLRGHNKVKGIFIPSILKDIMNFNTEKRNVPLFLSNFAYIILESLSKATSIKKGIDDLDEHDYIINEELSDKKNNDYVIINEKKKIVDNYKEWTESISYYDKFNDSLDKILFEFEKERQLNNEFICYCANSGALNNDTYVKLDIIKATMSFPNIFSRNIFVDYFLYLSNNYGYESASDMIDKLYKETFPIIEKTFFASLFEHCNHNKDINDVLKNMDELLKKYIEINFDRIMNSWKSGIKKEDDNDLDKSVDINKVYSLIEFNFKYLFRLRDELSKDFRDQINFED